jgi:two-component system LytT family sensor kinase
MLHPFFNQSKAIAYYLSGWIVLAFLHWLILFDVANMSAVVALIDALVYNGVLLCLSLSFWFPLAYADKTNSAFMQLLNNVLVFVFYLGIWLALSWWMAHLFLDNNAAYASFTSQILPFRAIWGGVLLLLVAVLYHLFGFYQHLEEKKRHEETMKKLLKEAELKALKAQLNPHFLFNSLNSISSLTITDPDKAREMVNKLSDFLRSSLRSKNNMMHPLTNELANVDRYLEIEKVRFGNRLECENDIDDACWDMQLPAMLLQPLYENAVKHGVYESVEPVNIRTFCRKGPHGLEISIINNYDPESTPIKGEGVGLENVRNRLKTLFFTDGLLTVTRENHHFEVSLTIPQIHDSKNI